MDDERTSLLKRKHVEDCEENIPDYSSLNQSGSVSPTEDATPSVVIESNTDITLYKRRWYILFVYSMFAGTQGAVWNTWGPISTSAHDVFGWDASDISLLTNWGPISYLISAVFFSWMIEVKGLRWACLTSMFLVLFGCGLRCITSSLPVVTWYVHTGQAMVGLGGVVPFSASTRLSMVWFASAERLTTTAFVFSAYMFGFAASFVVGSSAQVSTGGWDRFINAGQCLVGAAGPLAMGGPPVISAVWFPPNERNTCTAIGFGVAILMTGMGFIIGPLMVPQLGNNTCSHNHTHINETGLELYELPDIQQQWDVQNCTNSTANIEEERNGIMLLMYVEFGWALGVTLLMLIYFPKKPPRPPCVTAALARESFWTGLKNLFRNKQFWLVSLVYGISLGVVNCWASVLDVNLAPLGIGEMEAGFIGFYATCSGCVGSLIVARFADLFSKHLKWFIVCLFTVSAGFFTWFALARSGIVPSSTAIFYATVIVGITAANSAVPLIFELACELTYPIGEGTTNGVLTAVNNLGGLIFLLVLMVIPNIHSMWMNWTVLGAVGVCIPLLFLLREHYSRFTIDESCPNICEQKIVQ